MMRRVFFDFIYVIEVFVSTIVHATYGLNLFLTVVWVDLMSGFMSSPQQSARVSPVIETGATETDDREVSNCVMLSSKSDDHSLGYAGAFMEGHETAPIVLVHGIFGFGSQVS